MRKMILLMCLLIGQGVLGQDTTLIKTLSERYICEQTILYLHESTRGPISLGLEFQAYPTGLIPGIRAEIPIRPDIALSTLIAGLHDWSAKKTRKVYSAYCHSITVRVGYQIINHQSLGVQGQEKGTGLGGSLGYRRYFKPFWRGFFLEGRCDLWINTLDWKTQPPNASLLSGTSTVTVVQPTLSFGNKFKLGRRSPWSITPSIAVGFEVNVATTGAETGQGLILLGGVSLMRDF